MSDLSNTNSSLWLCGREAQGRGELEQLIRDGYRKTYGAHVHDFLPLLLGLARNGEAGAVVGMDPNGPGSGHLLDSYLDRPCQDLMADKLGSAWDGTLCEIGNLISSANGLGLEAIAAMAAYLEGREISWAVFTATRSLRLLFRRVGLQMIHLAPATCDRLGPNAADWGSYYQTNPHVSALRLPSRRDPLMQQAGISEVLLESAFQEGRKALVQQVAKNRAVGA